MEWIWGLRRANEKDREGGDVGRRVGVGSQKGKRQERRRWHGWAWVLRREVRETSGRLGEMECACEV